MAGLTGRGSRRQKYSTVYEGVRDSRAGSLFGSRMKFSFLTRPDSGERLSPFVGKCFGKHQSL